MGLKVSVNVGLKGLRPLLSEGERKLFDEATMNDFETDFVSM